MQFRELIAWDYLVPDHYFDVQKLIQKKALQANIDTYTIPFKNFWRPVYFADI